MLAIDEIKHDKIKQVVTLESNILLRKTMS